jgi:transcription elongation factor
MPRIRNGRTRGAHPQSGFERSLAPAYRPAPLVCGTRIPAPEAGGRFPAPEAGGRIPAPEAGGRFPAPEAGGKLRRD